jgi:hypothetical protein
VRPLSASIPVLMSVLALAMVLGHAAIYGIVHEPDEGAAAHIFQLLMVTQIPFMAYFVCKWVHKSPQQYSTLLAVLAGLWVSAFAAVYWLT